MTTVAILVIAVTCYGIAGTCDPYTPKGKANIAFYVTTAVIALLIGILLK